MKDFEDILNEMLERVPDDLDKREGGIIYTALAPVAAQIAELYFYSTNIMDSTMPDTSRGEDLTRRCATSGVNRYPATKAIRKGKFTDSKGNNMDIPIGNRFGADNLTYRAVKRIETGIYELECEDTGKSGNTYFGAILPIDNISGLGSATLLEVLIAGEDEESDDELRTRFYQNVNSEPFGGNVAQYETEILKIPGVGGVKIFPTPDGKGGKVQCVIVNPEFKPASSTLVNKVQEIINPPPRGQGVGIAPIGHDVTISTVTEYEITVDTNLTLKEHYTLAEIQSEVENAIRTYINSISFKEDTVRISKVDAVLLQVTGIADVTNTRLNGKASNIVLPTAWNDYKVPKLGVVNLMEVK